jgi:ASC-1-like (ASCH) protein
MERKANTYTLRFAKGNKDTFEHIKAGRKTVETRAGTVKYRNIQKGEILVFSCDGKKIVKKVKKVSHFKTLSLLLKKYKPNDINPDFKNTEDAIAKWYSFPGYREKIAEFGILAFELE